MLQFEKAMRLTFVGFCSRDPNTKIVMIKTEDGHQPYTNRKKV